jgi:hypothetical protein
LKILLVILYGYETWSVTLSEEQIEGVELKMFGPKRDEVTGGWRELHSEELHNLYSSAIIIRMIRSRKMRWAEHIVRLGEMTIACRFCLESLVGRDHSKD